MVGQDTRAAEWTRHWTLVLASGAGVALSTTHIYSLGVMMAPLQAAFGWSRAQISSGMTVGSVLAVLSSPFVGLLVDRIGPRRIALCGAALYCATVALLATATPSIWVWLILWTGLAIGVSGITPTIWTSAVSGAFERSRGLALSVTLCGTGLGSALTPLITARLEAAYGWRIAYAGLAGFWAVGVLPLLYLFFAGAVDRRRRSTLQPDAAAPRPSLTGLTTRKGFRAPSFYKLAIAAVAIALVAVSFAVNLVPILTASGLTRQQAAEIAGIAGIASIVGRLTAGSLIDRFNGSVVAAVSVLLPVAASALLLLVPSSVPAAIAVAALVGLSLGAELDAVAYLATRHLGMRNFGVLFGTISGLLSLATGVGPLAVSLVYDATRSYQLVLIGFVPLCILSAVLFLSLGRYPDFAEPN